MQTDSVGSQKTASHQPPVLSAFTDFRQYLREFYEFKKLTQSSPIRPYSYATFSASANIRSPNYLKLIIEGQRNLSADTTKKFAKALQLNKAQTEEFIALVNYGQAQDPFERNQHLKVLADIRVKNKIRAGEIKEEVWENIPSWVTWTLFAMADQKDVKFEMEELRTRLQGRAKRDEIKKALDYLIDKGALKQNEDGSIEKGRLSPPSPTDIPPALIRQLQAELIYLGMEALFQTEADDREYGSFTMSLTEDEYEKLKFELRHLRKRILRDAMVHREKSKGDRVFQMNLQLFPVTK